MLRRFFLTLAAISAGWLCAAGPAAAQDLEDDPWAELKPKLTGLGKMLWDFAGATPYLGELPRAGSVAEVEGYGYFLDEANGFLDSASWDGPCGCGEWFRAAAFKKSDGKYLLVKTGVGNTCNGVPMAEATEPWEKILPPGFSLEDLVHLVKAYLAW